LLLKHQPLDSFGVGSKDLLGPGDGFHLPTRLLAGTVLVLGMDMAIFVAMELIGFVFGLSAARAGL
jgi:hypothetical protein